MGRHSRPRRGFGRTAHIPRARQGAEDLEQPAPREQVGRPEETGWAPEAGTPRPRTPSTPTGSGEPGRERPYPERAGGEHVRGGHPAHPERPRAPYGPPPGRPTGPPSGAPRGASVVPGPRRPAPAPGPEPGEPRQEYLDAFDRPTADGDLPPGSDLPPGRPAAEPHTAPLSATDSLPEPEEPEVTEDAFARGRRGRTMTGVAAAAITTVLAVLVAGQVATGRDDGRAPSAEKGDTREADGGTSRGDERPPPAERKPPEQQTRPATYQQKMAAVFALDPELAGPGRFDTVGGSADGPKSGRAYTYRVDVEKGLGLDARLFAEAVHKTLNDERSWAHGGERSFSRVSSGRADFVMTLASPGTTADWCAKSGLDTTEDNVSCDSAATERIMINAYRWARGAKTFGPDNILAYRQMLINHEVGHRLGYGHVECARDGALAPVMMQQTKFLTTGDRTCRPNPWPHPDL
ncbi:DUF3152 domain-containing protein [Streptomyces sp. OF3]|uniref:DUF3152 domain-containing protein n=2 Tax=Streptomyces alkaliterrae TaxID=2213162 RepID=A0A7W3WPK6_9ACTN|nr:DUF3152 domain-containing protein [Streptomyces alkaliterrae]MBB1256174.1 DUF3152 domain-containing protein [Streptomyces alkaliterrae]